MKPTYKELVQKYFEARRIVINEFSAQIGKETLQLWDECNSWVHPDSISDTSGMVELYVQNPEDYIDNV